VADNTVYPADDASFGAKYLPNGFPHEIKSTQAAYTYSHPFPGDPAGTESYCICANLESDTGNATSTLCGGLPTAGSQYYCLRNLQ
jgi:hypothetical protein